LFGVEQSNSVASSVIFCLGKVGLLCRQTKQYQWRWNTIAKDKPIF